MTDASDAATDGSVDEASHADDLSKLDATADAIVASHTDTAVPAAAAKAAAPAAETSALAATIEQTTDAVLAPTAQLVGGTVNAVVAPVVSTVNPVLAPVVNTVGGTVDAVVAPAVEATAPVVAPVVNLARPAVQRVVEPVVSPVAGAAVPMFSPVVEPAMSRLGLPLGGSADQLVALPLAVDPAAGHDLVPAAPGGARGAAPLSAKARAEWARELDQFSAMRTPAPAGTVATPELPPRREPASPHAPRLPFTAAPAGSSSAGGRDLPDRTAPATGMAAAVAHAAAPAVGAPVKLPAVGAAEDSGSRPAFAPD